jgi:hypothetical protein
MALEPIVVAYKADYEQWIMKHGTAPSSGMERFDTKQEAVESARKWMKDNGMPAMVVLDKNWEVSYITLNSETLKDPMWWKRVDLLSF